MSGEKLPNLGDAAGKASREVEAGGATASKSPILVSEEPRQYFIDIYSLRLPGGLKYCVMCSWKGEIEATWSIIYDPFSRKGSNKLAFLLRLLDFAEGGG